jgi:hypothetical protein
METRDFYEKDFIFRSVGISLLLSNACSTIFNTTSQTVELKSNPPNAKITVDGKNLCKMICLHVKSPIKIGTLSIFKKMF